MGIDTFSIALNTSPGHIFHPGDTISGKLSITASPDVDFRDGVKISLFGVAKTEWQERSGVNSNVKCTGNEEFLQSFVVLQCAHDKTDYPFCLQLPVGQPLPNSCSLSNSSVEYGVRAAVKRPWFKFDDKKTCVAITVISHLTAELATNSKNRKYFNSCISSYTQISPVKPSVKLCFFRNLQDKAKFTLTAEKLWVCPGNALLYSLEIDNRGNGREIKKAAVQLVELWTGKGKPVDADEKDDDMFHYMERVVHEEILSLDVAPNDHVVKNGLLKIPVNIVQTQVECKIFQLTYKLNVVINEREWRRCVKFVTHASVNVDVIIVTKKTRV